MGSAARHRSRLWLRSEKAFGLESVRAGLGAPVRDDADAINAAPLEAKPVAASADRPTTRPAPEAIFADAFEAPPAPRLSELPPISAPVLPREQKLQVLAAMDEKEVRTCPKCRLCETRTHAVFGEGDADADIFFIGEGPGENEDLSGRPFVGKAGQLLDRMINAMGLKREQVYIANIVKCRPPNNRVPAPDEVAACTPYLLRQIEIVRPKVIVTLGRPAANYMLDTKTAMGQLRGRWQNWRGIKLMPTFHPAYVLRSYTEETRAAVWSDLKQVMAEVGLPPTKRESGA